MKYCKKCLQSDTRHGIEFNDDGICGGCLYTESMSNIDWDKRKSEFQEIADNAKKQAKLNNSFYDCVIGVSGGKDSTFIALYAKEKLGLNVLLVNSCPEDLTKAGRHNLDNLRNQGFDLIQFRPNPLIAKKVALRSFKEYGHICKAYEYTVTASSVIIADKFNIPLILNGENGALVWGQTKYQKGNDDWFQVVNTNTNQGCQAKDWVSDDISLNELFMYQIPDIEKLKAKGIKAVFTQYYVKEYTAVRNADFAVARGMKGRYKDTLEDMGRYRIFSSIDDDIMIVNEMLKYYKLGFGRASDDACLDIREGRIDREYAMELVRKYDGLCAQKYIDKCCNYLGISLEEFWNITDGWVNKKLFSKDQNGHWRLKNPIWEQEPINAQYNTQEIMKRLEI